MVSVLRCVACVLPVLFCSVSFAAAADAVKTLSLEDEREAALKEFDVTEVPDLEAVRASAERLFARPVSEQSRDDLKKLAKEANRAANTVGLIHKEYKSYNRDNYRYDFVQEKVSGPADAYGKIFNEFVLIRNKAYYNLGMKSKDDGKTMEAFLYFNDAFRLSGFDCGPGHGPKGCMRWEAEQEMQKLLGLSDIKAYVSWK